MSESAESISFAVEGDIDLNTFALAVDGLKDLANSLANDLVPHAGVEWELAGLEFGSASIALRPISASIPANRRLLRAYRDIGNAIAADRPLRFSSQICSAAQRLAGLSNNPRVSAVRFGAMGQTTVIRELGRAAAPSSSAVVAIGSVTGVVEAISRRGNLHLTLIDDVFRGRVSLHLQKGQEELGRKAWDRHVIVSGLITEQPGSGRPTSVRNVTEIRNVKEYEPGAWRTARGVFPWQPGDPTAEQLIREIRGRA